MKFLNTLFDKFEAWRKRSNAALRPSMATPPNPMAFNHMSRDAADRALQREQDRNIANVQANNTYKFVMYQSRVMKRSNLIALACLIVALFSSLETALSNRKQSAVETLVLQQQHDILVLKENSRR